jgi:hypothetical protein
MDIAGIEYTICISDPDISGYKQWLCEHKSQSPLDDEREKKFSISLSDINPLLIKTNADKKNID